MRQSSNVSIDHDELGFAEAVLVEFDFLLREYDFVVTYAGPRRVRFERGQISVDVIFEAGVNVLIHRACRWQDGPRGLWQCLRHQRGTEFPLEYLAMAANAPADAWPGFPVVETEEQMVEAVSSAAAFLREQGRRVLTDDDEAYRELAAISRSHERRLTSVARRRSRTS